MTFLVVCLYTCVIFLRPAEILPVFHGVPFFLIFSILSVVCVVVEGGKCPRLPQNKMLLFFAVSVVLSNITVGWVGGAWGALYRMSTNLVYYFCLLKVLTTKKRITAFLYVLTGLIFVLSVHGFIQAKTGVGFGDIKPFFDTREGGVYRIRYSGTLNDPNDFSLVLVSFLAFPLLGIRYKKWSILLKILIGGVVVLVGYNIYCTYSRGAIVGTLILLILFFAVKKISIKRLTQGLAFAVLLMMLAPAVSGLLGTASLEEESAAGRVIAWEKGLQAFRKHPLFGIGYNRFDEIHNHAAHNAYVQVMTEEGTVGLYFFMGMIYFNLCHLLSIMKLDIPDSDDAYLVHSLFIALVVFFVMILFLSRAYNLYIYLLMALSSAVIAKYPDIISNGKGRIHPTGGDWFNISLLTVFFIFGIYIIVRFGLRG